MKGCRLVCNKLVFQNYMHLHFI